MSSNRFTLVDREPISGHVGGTDFGYNLWQPAGWDQRTQSWALIGSNQTVAYWQPCILEVDETPAKRLLT